MYTDISYEQYMYTDQIYVYERMDGALFKAKCWGLMAIDGKMNGQRR